MKTTARLTVILTSAGLCTGLASATETARLAEVETLSGKVMVYDGTNYRVAEPGMPLGVGNQVLTLKDGKADVAFQAGCVANLEENATLTIPDASVPLCIDGKFVPPESPVTLVYASAIGSRPAQAAAACVAAGTCAAGSGAAAAGGAGAGAAGAGAAGAAGAGAAGGLGAAFSGAAATLGVTTGTLAAVGTVAAIGVGAAVVDNNRSSNNPPVSSAATISGDGSSQPTSQ